MWVRYDATNKWWEFSTDNINFNRLEENPLIPDFAEFIEASAPSSPAANRIRLYAKDKAGTSALYLKNDAGTEIEIAAAPSIGIRAEEVYLDLTPVGNVGTGEDPGMSYALGAGLLAQNGDEVEFMASGTYAANANNKIFRPYLGTNPPSVGTLIRSVAQTISGGYWYCFGRIIRVGASAQKVFTSRVCASPAGTATNPVDLWSDLAETHSNNLKIAFTLEGTSNNDIVQNFLRVVKKIKV